jgi:hypothetical protein
MCLKVLYSISFCIENLYNESYEIICFAHKLKYSFFLDVQEVMSVGDLSRVAVRKRAGRPC